MDAIIAFLERVFGAPLATVLGSMIPLIELKGSIMFARSEQIGMGFWESFGLSFLGSTAVFFILFFLLVPVLNLLKKWKFFRNIALAVETYIQEKAEKERAAQIKAAQEKAEKERAAKIKVAQEKAAKAAKLKAKLEAMKTQKKTLQTRENNT